MEWFIILLFAGGAFLVHRFYSRQHRRNSSASQSGDVAPAQTQIEITGLDDDRDTTVAPIEWDGQALAERAIGPSTEAALPRSTGGMLTTSASDEDEVDRRPFRHWREAAGFSCKTLASASGLSPAIVQQIDDETRTPTEREAFTLSNILGIPIERIRFSIRSLSGFDGRSRTKIPTPGAVSMAAFTSQDRRTSGLVDTENGAVANADATSGHLPTTPFESQPFGDRIVAMPMSVKSARERRQLTVRELAERSGTSVSTLVQIENDTRTPTPEVLQALVDALGIGASRLLVRSAPVPAEPVTVAVGPDPAPTVGKRISRFAESVRQSRLPYRWVGSEEVLEIGGHTIRGGLFFVGRELQAPRSGRKEPSLIDPSAKVSASGADVTGTSVPYWPSYSEIPPAARLAYLQWMAGGRSEPDYGICYPFIFLYGLERRLFHDGETGDAPAIAAEVERLLAIYGRNYSFRNYASRLLGAASALLDDVPRPSPSLELWTGEELPVAIRLHVGRRIAEGTPLDAEDALVWLLGHPETRTRTAVERCFAEARLVWRSRFAERFPAGMKVASPKRTIRIRYGAASSEFETEIVPSFRGQPIPDIVGLSAPLKWMREALDAVSDDLQPYSRLFGRKPEARGTIEAALLVPQPLVDTEFGAAARVVGDALRVRLAVSGMATIPFRSLISSFGLPDLVNGKVSAATITQVGRALDRLDLGMEPDRRYGSGSLAADGDVVLFSALGGGRVDADREAYKAVRTMIEVAALAAAADDSKDLAELAAIEADIEAAAELDAEERTRLRAFARYVMGPGAKQGSVLSRLAKMPDLDRRRVARSAMSAVLADGHASPAEIRFLEKLFKTMGLPVDDLYSAIHRGAIEVDAPVSIASEEITVGVAIPRPPSAKAMPATPTIFVDQARLDRIRSETSAVSQLLADIFEEEEAPASTMHEEAASVAAPGALLGLDAAHGRLLRSIMPRATVDRSEFDRLAREFGLLPDGAIETINEWAFDRFDESILDEVDDGVAVADHLSAELNNASEMA